MKLIELVSAMEDAGTVDLRGDYILPWILKVVPLRPDPNGAARARFDALARWMRSGAHRLDRQPRRRLRGKPRAVQIMDAWWPLLVEAQFKPTLGADLFNRSRAWSVSSTSRRQQPEPGLVVRRRLVVCREGPAHAVRSAGARRVLARLLRRRRSRAAAARPCSARSRTRSRCRTARLYPASCAQGDAQWCYDAVEHQALG